MLAHKHIVVDDVSIALVSVTTELIAGSIDEINLLLGGRLD
jgi:hypothetical protein